MALVDVTKACLDSFIHISEHINGAIVYLDSGCAESFQFIGAYSALVELGATAVCALEKASPLDAVTIPNSNIDVATKIVVFTCRMLSDAHRYVLRCLATHSGLRSCSVLTSVSEVAHSAYPDSPLGPDAYQDYKSLLLLDYEEIIRKRGGHSAIIYEGDASHSDVLTFDVEDSMHVNKEDAHPKLDVSVLHFPLMLCPFSRRFFAFPSESSVAEACLSLEEGSLLSPGLPPISKGVTLDADEIPPGAFLSANFLYHLADKLDLKLEIFSLGDLSKAVGNIMIGTSSLYETGSKKRAAGLLLLDRTLDLFTPCAHGDSLFDRMVSVLPRKQRISANSQLKVSGPTIIRPSLDMKIPIQYTISKEDLPSDTSRTMAENINALLSGWERFDTALSTLDFLNQIHDTSNEFSLNGSFLSMESFRGTSLLEAVLDRKTKEGVVLVKKFLEETLRREHISVNAKRRDIKSLVNALAKSESSLVRNKGIIQLAAGVLCALDEPQSEKWEALISAENMLGASADDSIETLGSQLRDLVTTKTSSGLISIEDSLLLLMIGYMLAGEISPTGFTWQEEHFLKESVVDGIFSNPSAAAKLKFLNSLVAELEANAKQASNEVNIDDFDDEQWDQWGDEDDHKEHSYSQMQLKLELRDRVDSLFNLLGKVSWLRKTAIVQEKEEKKGLVYNILSKVLRRGEVSGLEYHSSTVGRLFKSGLGRFGLGQAKPSLGDHNVIMVFVVGGISSIEVREAMEALSQVGRPDVDLILAGTTLLTPHDMFHLLIGDSSFF